MHASATPRAFELGQHGQPELGRLPGAGPDPQAQHLLGALAVDPDGQAGRPVRHHPVSDLDHQRVDEDHRIDRVQRPGLPLGQLLEHTVGDPRDQVRRDVHVIHLAQVRADIAGRHPARVQRDDPLAVPVQPGLPLAHDLRLEAPVAVAGHRQVDGPDIGEHGLRGGAVAAVAAAPPGRIVLLIAQVAGHLLGQRPLQHRPGHLGQQAVRAEQLRPFGMGLAQQLIRQLLIDKRPGSRLPALTFAGHLRSVLHRVSFREPPSQQLVARPRHLHSR